VKEMINSNTITGFLTTYIKLTKTAPYNWRLKYFSIWLSSWCCHL